MRPSTDYAKWPVRDGMYGVPEDFTDQLHDLIADWLEKGMTFDEIADDIEYMLSQISLHSKI